MYVKKVKLLSTALLLNVLLSIPRLAVADQIQDSMTFDMVVSKRASDWT